MFELIDNASNWKKITCCECGISFYVPRIWKKERENDHAYFSCPNKHSQYYPQDSETEVLDRKLLAAQCAADEMEQCCINAEKRRAAQKGATTKLRNALRDKIVTYGK